MRINDNSEMAYFLLGHFVYAEYALIKYIQDRSHPRTVYRVAQKKLAHFFVRLITIKYWPIFKIFSLSESVENF